MFDDLRLFALSESRNAGSAIADALNVDLADHVEYDFNDGEHKTRPSVNVRGKDVFVVQPLYDDPEKSINDKLCRLLFFCGALHDASADRVTVVAPYLCYQRSDRKTQPRDPITTRYIAGLLESVGVDRMLTIDVHNLAAFQNSFRCRTDHLEARPLFVRRLAGEVGDRPVVVVSPDEGGMKRANRFAKGLRKRLGRNVPTAFVEKFRSGQDLSGGTLVGDVEGAVAVVVDDLIGTGGTICQATRACVRGGAEGVVAAVTHGVFVGDASEKLTLPDLDAIYVTNTIPPFRLAGSPVMDKLTVCDVSERFAAAIRAIHAGGSVTTLNEMEPTVRQPDAEGEDDGRASPETTQSAVEAEPNLTP
jgi:ribose-phosphate pyrophosphokinase